MSRCRFGVAEDEWKGMRGGAALEMGGYAEDE
jgi:hypothetical protein